LDDLSSFQRPSHIPGKHFSTFFALCCWQLWKRRNGVVFRSESATTRNTLAACSRDVDLWKARLPKKDAAIAQSWLGVFSMAM
jgi:hypothetical protein